MTFKNTPQNHTSESQSLKTPREIDVLRREIVTAPSSSRTSVSGLLFYPTARSSSYSSSSPSSSESPPQNLSQNLPQNLRQNLPPHLTQNLPPQNLPLRISPSESLKESLPQNLPLRISPLESLTELDHCLLQISPIPFPKHPYGSNATPRVRPPDPHRNR